MVELAELGFWLLVSLIVLGLVAVFLLIPFMALGGGVLSLGAVIGISWRRPTLITRSLGVLGLSASVCLGILWLAVTPFLADVWAAMWGFSNVPR